MKITVDCRSLESVGGIAVYTRQLLNCLLRIDRDNEYRLVLRHPASFPESGPNIQKSIFRFPGRIANFVWRRWRILPLDLFTGAADIFFSPNFTLPHLSAKVKTVITIHDLAFLKIPGISTRYSDDFLRHWVSDSVRRADHIIAISHCTKRDIVEIFGFDSDRISVVYNGVDRAFVPLNLASSVRTALREKYGLPNRFILYHGTLEPRKNLPVLLKAFASARLQLKGLKLVLSGRKGWLYDDIFKTVRELGLEADVVFPGFIENADLPKLYNLCEFFAFVSKYEGFGLPPLEAMACGKAVIVSDVSSLPEVVGEAGFKVAPEDWKTLGDCMIMLANDESLRRDRERASLRQAAKFSWEASAVQTRAALSAVSSSKGSR